MTREVLNADRTLYVRASALYTDAPGRIDTTAGACQTWAQAVALAAALDFNQHTVTIQHGAEGAHTFTESVQVATLVGGGALVFAGSSTPGNTAFNTVGADCFDLTDTHSQVNFRNMTLQNSAGGSGLIQPSYKTTLIINSGMVFGPAFSAHIWVHDAQAQCLLLSASYTINGGTQYHIFINGGMTFLEASTVTLTGTPAFSGAFVGVMNGGKIQSPVSSGMSFVGSATGPRYSATTNGVINSFGGGATYFPGNSAGAVASGGTYA